MKHNELPIGVCEIAAGITMSNAENQFSTEAGNLVRYSDGTFELCLFALPTAGSELEFPIPTGGSTWPTRRSITAIINGPISEKFIEIGFVETVGEIARVKLFGLTEFNARLVF